MGLRKEFLMHKTKTVESFRVVKTDISSINMLIDGIKNTLHSMESRASAHGSMVEDLRKSIDKCLSGINLQQANSLDVASKIGAISKSVSSAVDAMDPLKSGINMALSQNRAISKALSAHSRSIKKIMASSKAHSFENRQMKSALRNLQKEHKRLKNIFNRKFRAAGKRVTGKKHKREKFKRQLRQL